MELLKKSETSSYDNTFLLNWEFIFLGYKFKIHIHKKRNISKLEPTSDTFENTTRINFLPLVTQKRIFFELDKEIPGCTWMDFATATFEILKEPWIINCIHLIEKSSNPSKEFFACWSIKHSYTIGNLAKILQKLQHETLLSEVDACPTLGPS